MILGGWLSLASVCLLGAISPGPSLALVVRNTLGRGRLHGLATGIAHGTGVALYALLTALGLGVLIANTPWLFDAIRFIGAAFLLWLGIKALRSRGGLLAESADAMAAPLSWSAREGLLLAFLNPKLALFFVALFSQFVPQQMTLAHAATLTLTAGGIDLLWYSLVAVGLSHAGVMARLQGNSRWVERLSGLLLLTLGLRALLM